MAELGWLPGLGSAGKPGLTGLGWLAAWNFGTLKLWKYLIPNTYKI